MRLQKKDVKVAIIVTIVSLLVLTFSQMGFAQNKEPINLRISAHVEGTAAREAMDLLIEYTNKKLINYKIEPTIYILGEVSGAGEGIESMQADMIDMQADSPSWETDWVPKVGIMEQAFLFDDAEHVHEVLQKGLGGIG